MNTTVRADEAVIQELNLSVLLEIQKLAIASLTECHFRFGVSEEKAVRIRDAKPRDLITMSKSQFFLFAPRPAFDRAVEADGGENAGGACVLRMVSASADLAVPAR